MSSTAINSLAIGDGVRSKALAFAAKTGPSIDMIVQAAANAKHEFSLAPINLYRAIMANLSEEDREALPMPGMRWKDAKTGSVNNNPDVAEWQDPSKPDSKPKEISFYVIWADGTPEGQHVVTELEWCNRVSDDKMKRDGIPAEWLAKYDANPMETKKRKKFLEGRRGTVRKAYKDAVRLLWQLDMVNELQGCIAELGADDDNTVEVANKAAPRREWKLYSVGSFLKLNVVKANAAGGTYAALTATAERKREPGGNAAKGKVFNVDGANAVKTPAQADIVSVALSNYLDRAFGDMNGSDYSALLKHVTGPGGAQSAHTLMSIKKQLDKLFRMDNVRAIAEREEQAAA